MSRLSDRFAALRARGEKALIAYIVAGDPSLEQTVEMALALESAGVDAIELGVPFSDPLADGPVIQAAAHRALESGVTLRGVLGCLREIRRRSEIPVVLMTYYNPALRYGLDRFAADAAEAGADGVIQTDLTPEEAGEWLQCARSARLDTIFLLAPTSTQERIEVVARMASGFVYCVSRTGVTGARSELPPELRDFVARVRAGIAAGPSPGLPVCVGFGISQPEHVRAIGEIADGAVVGSALVDLIAREANSERFIEAVRAFAARLKSATRSPERP